MKSTSLTGIAEPRDPLSGVCDLRDAVQAVIPELDLELPRVGETGQPTHRVIRPLRRISPAGRAASRSVEARTWLVATSRSDRVACPWPSVRSSAERAVNFRDPAKGITGKESTMD